MINTNFVYEQYEYDIKISMNAYEKVGHNPKKE